MKTIVSCPPTKRVFSSAGKYVCPETDSHIQPIADKLGEFEIISSQEKDDEIVEVIRIFSTDGDGKKVYSDATAVFDKQTGALKKMSGDSNGMYTVVKLHGLKQASRKLNFPTLQAGKLTYRKDNRITL